MNRRPVSTAGVALSVSARQQIDAIMDIARNQIEAVLQREVSRLVLRAQEDASREAERRRENAEQVLAARGARALDQRSAGPQPIYVRPVKAQEIFGVHRATLYRWADAGHINIHKRGAATFVRVDEVRAFIEGNQS